MKKLSLIFALMFLVTVAFNNAQAQERKKWSPQAKGAVIGAGTGAAAGAIINKRNRVVGGVVGGAVGGAAGYGVGKIVDNKRKKREAEFNRSVAANRAYSYNSSNRSAGSTARKSTSTAARTAAVAAPATMAYTGYTAGQPQIMTMSNLSFLPNEHYGDYSKPYADSEYRRKSW